jgi:hypothetical protein
LFGRFVTIIIVVVNVQILDGRTQQMIVLQQWQIAAHPGDAMNTIVSQIERLQRQHHGETNMVDLLDAIVLQAQMGKFEKGIVHIIVVIVVHIFYVIVVQIY